MALLSSSLFILRPRPAAGPCECFPPSYESPTICVAVNVGVSINDLIVEITEASRCLGKVNYVLGSHGSNQGKRNVRYISSGSNGFSIKLLFLNASRSSMDTLVSLQGEKPCFDHLHWDSDEDRPRSAWFLLNPI